MIEDRQAIVITGALLIIAALRGTEEDVQLAAKRDVESLVSLSRKYYHKALLLAEIIQATHRAEESLND